MSEKSTLVDDDDELYSPTGLLSKKLIGHLTMAANILLCNFIAACTNIINTN